jgi:mono/diheme cytochrome c family protein
MKRFITLLTLALFVAGGSTIALADGAADYDKLCAKCHGKDGKGDTKMGKKLKVRDLTDAKVQASFTDEQAAKAIADGVKKDGKTKMKGVKGKVDDAGIKALVAYVRSLKK